MTGFFLFLLVLLIVLNGFFVAAEFALVRSGAAASGASSRRKAPRGAALAMHEMDRIDEYLSAAQVGITMASIGLGFLGEPAIAQLLEPLFGSNVSHGVAVAISVTIAYLFVTAAHVIVGEQAPKIMAITHPETVATWVARPLEWFRRRASSRDLGAQRRRPTSSCERILRIDVEALRGDDRRGAADAGRARPGRRGARPGRGRHAQGRLPPARAAGAAGDDADAGAGDGRTATTPSRRACAAASARATRGWS